MYSRIWIKLRKWRGHCQEFGMAYRVFRDGDTYREVATQVTAVALPLMFFAHSGSTEVAYAIVIKEERVPTSRSQYC